MAQLIRSPKAARDVIWRAKIWLYASACPQLGARALGELVGRTPKTVRKHVGRLEQSLQALEAAVAQGCQAKLERLVEDCLQDAPRSGSPPTFSPGNVVSIISLACEKPEHCGQPVSKWTAREVDRTENAPPFLFISESRFLDSYFGIVKRRGVAGASFKSTAELLARIDHFIGYSTLPSPDP